MEGMEMTVETVEVTPDAKGDVSVAVPDGMTPAPAAPAELSFKAGDLQSDLAKIAAETGVIQPAKFAQPQTPSVTPEPVAAVEPEQPATAPATPVPDKFKNPDGTVNEDKVAKSTVNAEEALAKYAEVERKLRQAQNSVNALKNVSAQQTPAVPQNVQLSPLEHAMAQDLINKSAAQGLTLDPRLAIAQAQVMAQGLEAKHAAEQSLTASLQERLDLQDRRSELEKIAQDDTWVLSPEGFETLSKIRQDYPEVNASKTPWSAAYDKHLAIQVKQSRLTGQVLNPTPTAKTAKAPPTPVNAVQRAVVKPSEPDFSGMSTDQISAYAASLGPKGEAAFWAKRGLKL